MIRAAALLVCASAAHAQTVSLDEIVRLADVSAQERGVALAMVSVRRADAALQAAQSPFEWGHSGTLAWRRQLEYVERAGALTAETVYRFNLFTTLGFDRLFENGIRVQPGMLYQRGDQATTSLLGTSRVLPTVTVDIPVNGSLGSPAEKLRLEQARRNRATAELDAHRARQVHLHRVVTMAWGWLAAQERVRLLNAAVVEAETQMRRTRQLADRGEIAPFHVAREQARLTSRRVDVSELQQTAEALRAELVALLGSSASPVQAAQRMEDRFPAEQAALNVSELVNAARQARPDLLRARERVETARMGLRIADRQGASKLSVVATHESLGLSWGMALGQSRANALAGDALAEMEAADLGLQQIEQELVASVNATVQRIRTVQQALAQMESVERELEQIFQALTRSRQAGAGPDVQAQINDALDARVIASQQVVGLRLTLATAIADLRLHTGQIPGTPGDVARKVTLFRSVQ